MAKTKKYQVSVDVTGLTGKAGAKAFLVAVKELAKEHGGKVVWDGMDEDGDDRGFGSPGF